MNPARKLALARAAYIGVLLLATLSGLGFSPDLDDAAGRALRALSFEMEWRDAIDGVRNIALFAGFGALWVVTSLTGRVRRDLAMAVVFGVMLSTTIEGVQCFSTVRRASVLDVFTNTAGSCAGAAAVALLVAQVARRREERSYIGVPAFAVAGAYVLAMMTEALTPLFRSNELTGVDGGPLRKLAVSLDLAFPLSIGEVQVTNLILFAGGGFLAYLWLAEAGSARRWPRLVAAGALALPLMHLAHGAFGLPIRFEAAAVDILGFSIGVSAGARSLAPLSQRLRGAERARGVLVLLAVLLLAWGLRPFFPETDFGSMRAQFTAARFIPLASLAIRGDVFSAVHVLQQAVLYAAPGVVLAVWPLRATGILAGFLPVVWLALVIEVGHVVIAGRMFDITNAIIACAGAAMAWVVVRRSGFPVRGLILTKPAS